MSGRFTDENRVTLSGRLCEAPELRVTPRRHLPVCRFTLAVHRVGRDNAEETVFVPIVTWSALAQQCAAGLQKGSPVRLEGRLGMREWVDRSGTKHRVFEVIAHRVELIVVNPQHRQSSADSSGVSPPQEDPPYGQDIL